MEEDYQKALEVIFAYGYECCVFKHNIYGDHLEGPDGMPDSSVPLPPEFFGTPSAPRSQQILRTRKSGHTRARQPRNLRRMLLSGTKIDSNTPFFVVVVVFFFFFCKGPCLTTGICVLF